MQFRTEIEVPREPVAEITHDTPVLMLGSCFTDNVGRQLEIDGFRVTHNPMGTLYNPASILEALRLALSPEPEPLYVERDGLWHCMNFATRYTAADAGELHRKVTADLASLREAFDAAKYVIVTLGTAYVYFMQRGLALESVGNCHKFPSACFTRRMLAMDEITRCLNEIVDLCAGKQVIFTVSPIRHTADTLHGNQLSKSSLLLAIDKVIAQRATSSEKPMYFPAYEVMIDDLRDYRFYAADMKHPSDVAVEYIYGLFSSYYFTPDTMQKSRECRKACLRAAHRDLQM